MHDPTTDVAFTPAVKALQSRRGSRAAYARLEARGGWSATITDDLAAFIADMEVKPDWLDMELVEEGARAERNNAANKH